MKFVLLVLVLLSRSAFAQSPSLETTCNLESLPTTRTDARVFEERVRPCSYWGPNESRASRVSSAWQNARTRVQNACVNAGFTTCEVYDVGNDCAAAVRGSRQVPLSRNQIREQACAQAALCYDRAIISSHERALNFMEVAVRVRDGYRCRNF